MIIIRNIFVAKPGNASKLAALFKSAAAASNMPRHRVLSDMTGDFNRVILEYEVDSLSGFEQEMNRYATDEGIRAALTGYTELYITGSREILQTA